MFKPDSKGNDAFARFWRAAAVQREFQALPSAMQTSNIRKALASGRHNSACLGSAMADVAAAIATGASRANAVIE
jgi:hypothetical protein